YLQKRWEFPASQSSPRISNCSSLHGEQFDLDIFCLVPEVEHGAVTVHRGTRVHDLHAVDLLDPALLVDVGAADKVKVFHVPADALAAHVLTVDCIEGFKWRGMGDKDVMDGLFHLCHSPVEQVIDLLVGQLERRIKRRWIGTAKAHDGHGTQVDLGAMQADCVRMFKRIEDLFGVTVARYRKTGYINAGKHVINCVHRTHIGDIAGDKYSFRIQFQKWINFTELTMEICYQKHIFHGISLQTPSKKPYLRVVPRAGQFTAESEIPAGFFCAGEEQTRTGFCKRSTRKRDKLVDVNFPDSREFLDRGNGRLLVFIGLERKPYNIIDHRGDPGTGTEFCGPDRLCCSVPPVEPGENSITS